MILEVEKVVLFCDICEAGEATGVTIEKEDRWSRVDLCERCFATVPLGEILEKSRASAPRVRRSGQESMSFSDALKMAREEP